MNELYKEAGKYFLNPSLLVIGDLLLKKIAEGNISFWEALLGFLLSLSSFRDGYYPFKEGVEKMSMIELLAFIVIAYLIVGVFLLKWSEKPSEHKHA